MQRLSITIFSKNWLEWERWCVRNLCHNWFKKWPGTWSTWIQAISSNDDDILTKEPWWNRQECSCYKILSVKEVVRCHLRLTTMLCEGAVDSVSPIPAMVSGGSQWALRGQNNVLFLSSGGRSSLRVYTNLAHVKLYIGQGKAKGASIKTR